MSRIFVDYLGQRVGALADARGGIFFEYDRGFIATGHELSPFALPLGPGVLSRETPASMRLCGLFEDALPDLWGRRVLTEGFRQRGIPELAVTPMMMLAAVGHRAIGALTFEPELELEHGPAGFSLAELHVAAQRAEQHGKIDLSVLAEVGSSAGGARPKALIGIHRQDPAQIVAGASHLPADFDAWIVKFDTSDDAASGPLEEAYASMARTAGIDVPETRLLETRHGGQVRRHFAVRRFDRKENRRIHYHSLAGLRQVGGGDLDYATFLATTRALTRDDREVWRAYRRAVFNVLASNRDDHGKNHGFLYRDREWRLAPAFDLTFASPQRLPERGMAVVGERRLASREHLRQLAHSASLDRAKAVEIIDQVSSVVARWAEFAQEAKVPALPAAEIGTVVAKLVG